MDLRQRIVDAYDQGDATRQKVAERFGVSLAFVKKLLSRRKRFGTIAPFLDRVGRKRAISPEGQQALRKHLARHPGATLAELRDALGLACSLVTVFNTLRRMKLTYKKTLRATEQDRPEIQARRKDWLAKCVEWIAGQLVFVDESATTTKMVRLYGRALRGHRARDAAPHGHWGVRTLIGALFGDGRSACMSIDAATNGEIFYQYIVRVLLPELRPDNIVVLDNLRSRRQQRMADAIRAAGALWSTCRPIPRPQSHQENVEQGQSHSAVAGRPDTGRNHPHCHGEHHVDGYSGLAGLLRIQYSFPPYFAT